MIERKEWVCHLLPTSILSGRSCSFLMESSLSSIGLRRYEGKKIKLLITQRRGGVSLGDRGPPIHHHSPPIQPKDEKGVRPI